MCGIAGFVSLDPPPHAATVLEDMTGAIHHRGPDAGGYHLSTLAFLGHRRLSIVDVAAGHQPMYNEDRSRVIVYNGEIFNHAEVRPRLEAAGHRFQTRADTEALLHAYEEYGARALDLFRGMFAFAIWDENSQSLFAARDRFGIKPFYYYWDGSIFVFASEIKALLAHPAISAEPEDSLISEYLAFGYTSGERTLFRGIHKLMPGHWLRWTKDHTGRPSLHIERYWDVPAESIPGAPATDADWIGETRRRLEETVRLRLMADVPLGTFLSGGVDSSAITALVQRMVPGRVQTFSVGYQENAYSELAYARQVAERLGTEHRDVTLTRDGFFSALPALIWHEDEPIAWPSSVSLYFVSRLAARHVKVVLTGEGADELFGGYERYHWTQLNLRAASAYRFMPEVLRGGIRNLLASLPVLRGDMRRKLSHTFLGRELTVESLHLDNFYSAFPAGEQEKMLHAAPGSVYDSYLSYWNARPHSSLLQRMLYADQKTYLVELLMKQDQMSMAASIESRVPFLDHEFAAFAASMPDTMKIRGGEQKYALKKAVEDLLPRDIVYRRKMGFPTPLKQWLREPDAAGQLATLTGPDSFISRWVRPAAVETLLERNAAGVEDATDRIWRLLNLGLWGKAFFAGRGAGPEAAHRLEHLAV